MPPKPVVHPDIPGIALLAPDSLAPDFAKFKNDALYFVSFVSYHPIVKTGDEAPKEKPKPVSRVFALTPAALFVCDTQGVMDRATRVEYLDLILMEAVTTKKFFGSEENMYIVVKVPQEFDMMVTFDKEKDNRTANEFIRIVTTLFEFKTKRKLEVVQLPAKEGPYEGKHYLDVYNAKAAEGYLSPKEIIAMNQARTALEARLKSINAEGDHLQDQLGTIRKAVEKKRVELKTLEAAAGSDITSLRKRKDEVEERHKTIHRKLGSSQVELAKLQSEAEALRAQLKDEQENFDQLVSSKANAADSAELAKQEEDEALRRNHRKKEVEKALKKLNELKAKCATPPTYTGPENVTSRAKQLEEAVAKAAEKWERDMGSFNRMEKMFDQSVSELKIAQTDVMEVFEVKKAALEERDAKIEAEEKKNAPPPPPPPPAQSGGLIDDDDDLLGGGGGAASPPSAGTSSPAPSAAQQHKDPLDDDDLLGGGGPPPPASAAPAGPPPATGGLDDDDLLGGGGGPSATPPPKPAAPPADDGLF